MNSYGSVALVSQSIYKLLRYMNWFSNDETDDVDANHTPSQIKPDLSSGTIGGVMLSPTHVADTSSASATATA